jgi:hypothetical protein
MKPPEMGKEAYLFRLNGDKIRENCHGESLAGKTGGKNVGTPIMARRSPGYSPAYCSNAARISGQ